MKNILLLSFLAAATTAAHAQLRVTPGATMTIAPGTAVVSDSLLIQPSSSLALSNFSITTSYTAIAGSSGGNSVQRVSELSQPITTAGTVGFWYADAELNGNTGGSLQIAYYDGSAWTTTIASTDNAAARLVSNTFSTPVTLSKITAINGATPLPVQLVSFGARAENQQARLDWEVAHAADVARYEVERSADGQSFQGIGQVAGTTLRGYIFYDASPLAGINYYRIRILAKDGSEAWSAVQPVLFSKGSAQQLLAYPIPVADVLHIRLGRQPGAGATLSLNDAAGKLVATQPCTATHADLDVRSLSAGIYFIHYDDGAQTLRYKLEKR